MSDSDRPESDDPLTAWIAQDGFETPVLPDPGLGDYRNNLIGRLARLWSE